MRDGNIYLIGFMGCGKSSVAAELSARLGFLRVELDSEIVRREGMNVNAIFKICGEDYFRDVESEVLATVVKECWTVVSCGGGTPLRPENAQAMKASGMVVWLTAEPETVLARVAGDTTRPLLNGNMNTDYIAEKMAERREAYERAADIIISTDGKSIGEICGEIIAERT